MKDSQREKQIGVMVLIVIFVLLTYRLIGCGTPVPEAAAEAGSVVTSEDSARNTTKVAADTAGDATSTAEHAVDIADTEDANSSTTASALEWADSSWMDITSSPSIIRPEALLALGAEHFVNIGEQEQWTDENGVNQTAQDRGISFHLHGYYLYCDLLPYEGHYVFFVRRERPDSSDPTSQVACILRLSEDTKPRQLVQLGDDPIAPIYEVPLDILTAMETAVYRLSYDEPDPESGCLIAPFNCVSHGTARS